MTKMERDGYEDHLDYVTSCREWTNKGCHGPQPVCPEGIYWIEPIRDPSDGLTAAERAQRLRDGQQHAD